MSQRQLMGRCSPGEPHCAAWLGLGSVTVLGAGPRASGPPPSPSCSGSCLFRTTTSSDYDIRPSEERRDVGFYRVAVQRGHQACCHCQGSWSYGVPQWHPSDRPRPPLEQPARPRLPALFAKHSARFPGEGRAGPAARGQSPGPCHGFQSRLPELRAGLSVCFGTEPQSSVSPEPLLRETCRPQKHGCFKEPADEAHFS